jgi:hypothetical protein
MIFLIVVEDQLLAFPLLANLSGNVEFAALELWPLHHVL